MMKQQIRMPNFNKIIESLQKQIDSISTSYDCNITRRRAEQLRSNLSKQDRLKDIQAKAKNLNEMWENGTIPEELKGLSNIKDIELLSYNHKYPDEVSINDSPEWYKEKLLKNKEKFDSWSLSSNEKVEKARKMLNELKLQLSEEEIKDREIKKIEDDIRGRDIDGFFPTPKKLIEEMIKLGDIQDYYSILEPSAGKGDMVDVLKDFGINDVDCIEINYSLRKILELKGYKLVGTDFLEFNEKKYDRIIMNPPFERLQDIEHIKKAYDTLNDGGILVSIMSASPFFVSLKKAKEFREWIEEIGAVYYKNDKDAFKNSFNSTGNQTYMIKIVKGGLK